jgi:uncharacterized membrane protein HdeD (DUF308 family)
MRTREAGGHNEPSFDVELSELRTTWGWLISLGSAQALLGLTAIVFGNGFGSAAVLGVTLILACILQIFLTLQAHSSARAGLFLVRALEFAAGVVLLRQSPEQPVTVPLLLPLFLVAHGAFRVVFGLTRRLTYRTWLLTGGVITLAAGVALWVEWATATPLLLGLAVGVNYITLGVFWVLTGAKLKQLLT